MLDTYRQRHLRLTCAESCTGGLVSAVLTAIAGSSDVLERGFVTYSNEAKRELLGVSLKTLETHGAVSIETAAEMAKGALQQSHADVAVSITGIAGPGGGTADKPVGLVCFGLTSADQSRCEAVHFNDEGRDAIREAAVIKALQLFLSV